MAVGNERAVESTEVLVTKTKIGRPYSIVGDKKTLEILFGLGKIQCTTKETAAVLGVSEPSLFALFKRDKKAREEFEKGQQQGRASLRRQQYKMAETNPTMSIWLGKQYLNQVDKHEIGRAGEFEELSDAELRERERDLDRRIAEIEGRTLPDQAGEVASTRH